MPTNRHRLTRTRLGGAFMPRNPWSDWAAEFLQADALLGRFHGDMEALEGYWQEHGEEITVDWAAWQPGTRPPAWWELTRGEERPDDQRAYLEGHGLLTDAEFVALDLATGV